MRWTCSTTIYLDRATGRILLLGVRSGHPTVVVGILSRVTGAYSDAPFRCACGSGLVAALSLSFAAVVYRSMS